MLDSKIKKLILLTSFAWALPTQADTIEFAKIAKPQIPILANHCKDSNCRKAPQTCAISKPFQLEARFALQSADAKDLTATDIARMSEQLELIRRARFRVHELPKDPNFIRAVFFDAFTGNRAAFQFLKRSIWPKAVREKFADAFEQLKAFETLCPNSPEPERITIAVKIPQFAGLVTWADKKTISVTLDKGLPTEPIQFHWPLVPGLPETNVPFTRVAEKTKVILFSREFSGRAEGISAEGIATDSPNEIEIFGIPGDQREKIIADGSDPKLKPSAKAIAVTNGERLSDPDHWQNEKASNEMEKSALSRFLEGAASAKCSRSKTKPKLDEDHFYSKDLGVFVVGFAPTLKEQACEFEKKAHWYAIRLGQDHRIDVAEFPSGFRPLIAANFEGRGKADQHAKWLGRSGSDQPEIVSLPTF